ncbi:hypothetical protein AB2M62_13850 [Sphingomonas sp. MMS12-HWE2-04]|uniref:hypothetical protein n=1 Tax=Sphingomonas sp. MMS12-HWE2-04 TaxID=3234199 RepID=UPI0038503F8D
MGIANSVGRNGVNDLADVLVVQHLLNDWLGATGQALLPTTGTCGALTLAAIQSYQARVLGASAPDGRIDPGGRSWNALASGIGIPPRLSGAAWWDANQARFPNSAALADLVPAFRKKVSPFVQALKDAGASVTISATRRNPVRAALMHYSWRVATGDLAPAAVPAIPGCAIVWDHGDLAGSKAGAQEMVDRFGIAYPPALTSRHIEGRAIDMTIGWTGTLKLCDAKGKTQTLTTPRTGDANRSLHAIGAGYGVIKLLSDPPHWSDDGH